MPLLIYWPMIVWLGLCGIAQEQLRVPVNKNR